MTDNHTPGHGPVNPTLVTGPFVLPAAEADLEAEARFREQLADIDREAKRPRARLARAAAFTWRWAANITLAVAISGGASFWLTRTFLGDTPVVAKLSDPLPEVATTCPDSKVPCAHAGEPIAFVQDMQRTEACGGEVIEIFSKPPPFTRPPTNQAAELVQQRRPVINPAAGLYPNVRQVTTIPKWLTPGRWGFSWSVDSRCPERERVDVIATFQIEVLP